MPQKNNQQKYKPLCSDCRYAILNLLDEYKIINLRARCKNNRDYDCRAIHIAKDEFIEELTMWIANCAWDAGDCKK